MARIPESEIERLKMQVSLLRLAEQAGVTLKRQGKDWLGRCPFHDDKTPSLVISPKANLWHCLGACQAGGSVVDWVMRFEGVSFRRAVELLRIELAPLNRTPRSDTLRSLFGGPHETHSPSSVHGRFQIAGCCPGPVDRPR